jgi:uncharacterized zinc-type alcohol dehydrogenase-like protein
MIPTKSFAAYSNTTPLAPFDFNRRAVKEDDVHVEILYCGLIKSSR